MVKNYFVKSFRIDKEMSDLITLLSNKTNFKKIKIVRWLLFRSLQELKADIQQAKGLENLEFSIKEIKKINQ